MKKLTMAELCDGRGLTARELAERAGLDERRVLAILEGRWLPSPDERDALAGVFALPRDQIVWGHRTEVSHLQGHGPQFGRSP